MRTLAIFFWTFLCLEAAYATSVGAAVVDPCTQLQGEDRTELELNLVRKERKVQFDVPVRIANHFDGPNGLLAFHVRSQDFSVVAPGDVKVAPGFLAVSFFDGEIARESFDWFLENRFERTRKIVSRGTGPGGLEWIDFESSTNPLNPGWTRIYSDGSRDKFSILVNCRLGIDVFLPCTALIINGDLGVAISMKHRELENWQSHKANTVALLNCMLNGEQ